MWNKKIGGLLVAVMLIATSYSASASSVEVAGVKFEDLIRLADTDLKLNGAGVRYKTVFKFYAAALYLKEKTVKPNEVIAQNGAKRISIAILRDLKQDEFGRGFVAGIQQNTEKSERQKLIPQFIRLGEMFSTTQDIKKGDVLTIDWIPASGTLFSLNGKKMSEIFPDVAFYNAMLSLWLGDRPNDVALKRALLGENAEALRNQYR
jgi:hypothetical protein